MKRYFWASMAGVIALGAAAACSDDEAQTPTGSTTTSSTGGGGDGGTTSSTMAGGNGGDVQMAGGGGTTSTSTGGSPPGYPAGPYGNQEGNTFPFLTWQGYLSTDPAALATAETWTDTYTSLDLHGSGAQYALIHTTLSG